jgi:hypothetical protein
MHQIAAMPGLPQQALAFLRRIFGDEDMGHFVRPKESVETRSA